MKRIFVLCIIGAGLTACSFGKQTFVAGKPIPLDKQVQNSRSVDSIVAPYKTELDQQMNRIVSYASVDFINQRPSGNLGNLIADVMLEGGKQQASKLPTICLINFGGLRAPISKGNVTLGDLFKVMPFDNQLVLVKMPANSMDEIVNYLHKSGGEPIAGFFLRGKEVFDANGNPWKKTEFWVVTSDYLMNGGDKMAFFEQKLEVIQTGQLFRDVLIQYATSTPNLVSNSENRIVIQP